MLLENFPLSEIQEYKIHCAISLNKDAATKKIKHSKTNIRSSQCSTHSFVKKMRMYVNKLLLILFIPVLQISNASGFAEIISLKAACSTYSDETVIRLKAGTTCDFDSDWDAYKLTNGGYTPNFYSVLNGSNYAINSFSGDFEEFSMPLNLKIAYSGSYSIRVKSLKSSYNESYTITLEDKVLNTTLVLTENAVYNFDAFIGDKVERFVIHYKKGPQQPGLVMGINDELENKQVEITATTEGTTVNFNNPQADFASVIIISSEGKVIYSEENISTHTAASISLNGNTIGRIYIVKVVIDEQMFCKKLYN